jgi:hypothetical protein
VYEKSRVCNLWSLMRFGKAALPLLARDHSVPSGRTTVSISSGARHRMAVAKRECLDLGDRRWRSRPADLVIIKTCPQSR